MVQADPTVAESPRHELAYAGHESEWQFVNGKWKTNDQGHLIPPGHHVHGRETYRAFYTKHGFGDCVVTAKWKYGYAGGSSPELIVRAVDSRRFYSVRCHGAGTVMCAIWKGDADGFQRMVAHRQQAGLTDPMNDLDRWYELRVECVGAEILVYFEGNFVCAMTDDQYKAGLVGVGTHTHPFIAWKDVVVQGQTVKMEGDGSLVEPSIPKQVTIFETKPGGMGHVNVSCAQFMPDGRLLVVFKYDRKTWWTFSNDHGVTWSEPQQREAGNNICYVPQRDECWALFMERNPDVEWHDRGTNFDELTQENFWLSIGTSKDFGQSWTKQRLDLFPEGLAYAPRKGKAGAVLSANGVIAPLSDGSMGLTLCWRNNPDGNYHSDQVQFLRTADGGETWSMSPVDETEWNRNESAWVELDDGELLCVLRSNYDQFLGMSRSPDKGKTWSQVTPGIPYYGSSAPSLFRTKDNVLVLGVRGWGLFTSLDRGQTWGRPTWINGYTGSGTNAFILEMPDGRLLVVGDDDEQYVKAQFVHVDRDGLIHPAAP